VQEDISQNLVETKPFRDRKSRYIALDFSSHNTPADRARELFKPSRKAENLLASSKKIPQSLGWNFFGGDVMNG